MKQALEARRTPPESIQRASCDLLKVGNKPEVVNYKGLVTAL